MITSSSALRFTAVLLLAFIALFASAAMAQSDPTGIFVTKGRWAWTNIQTTEFARTQSTVFVRSSPGLRYYGYGGCEEVGEQGPYVYGNCKKLASDIWFFDHDSKGFGLFPNSNQSTIRVGAYGAQVSQKLYLIHGIELDTNAQPREIAVFDLIKKQWVDSKLPENDAEGMAMRMGASVSVYESKIIFYGGLTYGGLTFEGPYEKVLDEVWAYDTATNKWEKLGAIPPDVIDFDVAADPFVPAKGSTNETDVQPIGRYGHVAGVVRNKLFVYGGATTGGLVLNETATQVFDLISHKWSVPPTAFSQADPTIASPGARFGANSAVISHLGMTKLYIYGGYVDAGKTIKAPESINFVSMEELNKVFYIGRVPDMPDANAEVPKYRLNAIMFPTTDGFILHGGEVDSAVLTDSWLYMTEPSGLDYFVEYIKNNQAIVGAVLTALGLFVFVAATLSIGRFIFYCIKRRKDKILFARLRGEELD